MNARNTGFDVEAMQWEYEQKLAELYASLLNGALWEEVKEVRKEVTRLSITLYHHRRSLENPAEFNNRN